MADPAADWRNRLVAEFRGARARQDHPADAEPLVACSLNVQLTGGKSGQGIKYRSPRISISACLASFC